MSAITFGGALIRNTAALLQRAVYPRTRHDAEAARAARAARAPGVAGEAVKAATAAPAAQTSGAGSARSAPGSGPALVVGLWRRRYLRLSGQQSILLAAPARTGKGVSIVIPNLLTYADSVVVLDIKQENFRITAGFRQAHGQQVFLFNPFAEDGRTHRYNPLSAVSAGAFRVGDILAIGYALYQPGGHDEFWKDQARNLFLGIVLLLCEWRDARLAGDAGAPDCPVTIGEVLRQSSGNGMPVKAWLQQVLSQHHALLGRACIDALNRFLVNDDRVLASVLATFNAPLTIWANPIVDAATSASDFDLREVRRRRMSVYIGITPDHLAEAALLVNLLFSQLISLNTKELPEDNPALTVQCLLLLDELTSVGRIGMLARAVGYLAGYNLRLLSVVQSLSQLESVYGRAEARTFMTNHAMQIVYAPREQRDASEYSEMLGTFTDRSRSVSRPLAILGSRGGASESVSEQRRPLMLPQELKELGRDRQIILFENTRPVLAGRIIYWRDPVFCARLREPPVIHPLDLSGFIGRAGGAGCIGGVRCTGPTVPTGQQVARDEARGGSQLHTDQAGEPPAAGTDAMTHGTSGHLPELLDIPAAALEILERWDPRDLPAHLHDITSDEAADYVERHFALLGVSTGEPGPAMQRIRNRHGGGSSTGTSGTSYASDTSGTTPSPGTTGTRDKASQQGTTGTGSAADGGRQ